MDDSSNSSNTNYQGNTSANSNSQNINVNVDNMPQMNDTDTPTNNPMNRNNVTVRDHLFQAMFSRIALTYDRTFPPFARRFIEFMLLLTAISVLFILIYIHMAFVKAPITCLDHFAFNENIIQDVSDGSFKHMVIRVEVLSNPPPKYSLYHSYSKEYDDLNRLDSTDSTDSSTISSSQRFNQMSMFLNIIRKQCDMNQTHAEVGNYKSISDKTSINAANDKEKRKEKEIDGFFSKLFNFPINPILEKAEYWREKLSVRAMAPFRQTFNELELFAKSVFTEEKYIMEYSLEYGLLRLTPKTRERLNIPVHFVLLDSSKDQCFGNALSRFLLQEFVGYDQIIIGSLKRLAERQNGKGYVRNVVSGEHYRFVNSWMSRTSYLAAGFIMIIFTLSVSMLLRYSHHQIFVFIVDLLRMLENNLQFSFPAAPLLTVVLALVGMEAIMSEFFNDTSTAFYTILIIWLADQYEAVCCRTYVSKRHWPKYFYLYHFAFYAYHYRFNGQFSGLALLCSWLFIQHSMFFFFHHYELPRLMHGIAVRAIMDSLIVERAENTSLTPSSMFPNDDDNDRSDGDRYDNDEGPGSSNMHPITPSGEPHEERENMRNCSRETPQDESHSRQNLQSSSNNLNQFHVNSRNSFTPSKKQNKFPLDVDIDEFKINLKSQMITCWSDIEILYFSMKKLNLFSLVALMRFIVSQTFTVVMYYIKMIINKTTITFISRYTSQLFAREHHKSQPRSYRGPIKSPINREGSINLNLFKMKYIMWSGNVHNINLLNKTKAKLYFRLSKTFIIQDVQLISVNMLHPTFTLNDEISHIITRHHQNLMCRIGISHELASSRFRFIPNLSSTQLNGKNHLDNQVERIDHELFTNPIDQRLKSLEYDYNYSRLELLKSILSNENVKQGYFNINMYMLNRSFVCHYRSLLCDLYIIRSTPGLYSSLISYNLSDIFLAICRYIDTNYHLIDSTMPTYLPKDTAHDGKYILDENHLSLENLNSVSRCSVKFWYPRSEMILRVYVILTHVSFQYTCQRFTDQIILFHLNKVFTNSQHQSSVDMISSLTKFNEILEYFLDYHFIIPLFDFCPEYKKDTRLKGFVDPRDSSQYSNEIVIE